MRRLLYVLTLVMAFALTRDCRLRAGWEAEDQGLPKTGLCLRGWQCNPRREATQ